MDLSVTPLWEEVLKLGSTLRQPQLSEFTGISVTALNRAVNHLQSLSLQDYRILEGKIDACKEIQRRAGAPINWKDIRVAKELTAAYEEELRCPPPPPTPHDWELLQFVHNPSMTPVEIARHLNITLTELSRRMAEASKRFDYSANKITARNADIAKLSKETVALVDASQAKRNQQEQIYSVSPSSASLACD